MLDLKYLATLTIVALGFCSTQAPQSKRLHKSTCEVANNGAAYLGEEVTVRGNLRGFHYLVLGDVACNTPESSLLVVNDSKSREQVESILNSTSSELQSGNIDMIVTIQGKISTIDRIRKTSECYAPVDRVDSRIRFCLIPTEIEP